MAKPIQLSEELIREIASELEIGHVCYLHIKTHEAVFLPPDLEEYEAVTGVVFDEMKEIKKHPKNYITIGPIPSSHVYTFMDDFTSTLSDDEFRKNLKSALQRSKPFSNFNHLIENSAAYRKSWYDFKSNKYLEWVREEIK